MIEIITLKDLSPKQISELIDSEGDIIKIYIPKTSVLHYSGREDIAHDYLLAAYAGQRLSEISDYFEYDRVPPEKHESILFKVSVSDRGAFSDVVINLTYLYGINEDRDADELELLESISQFEEDIEGGKVIPSCPYFIDIWIEFRKSE